MPAAMLIVDFRISFEDHKRCQYLFRDGDDARTVQEQLTTAAKAFHERLNDREQMATFETASGPSTVDVSAILSVGVDDPLGMAKGVHEEWSAAIGRLNGVADGAAESAKKEQA